MGFEKVTTSVSGERLVERSQCGTLYRHKLYLGPSERQEWVRAVERLRRIPERYESRPCSGLRLALVEPSGRTLHWEICGRALPDDSVVYPPEFEEILNAM